MRNLYKASGIVTAIALSALAPAAKAQETGHDICRGIGAFAPEQLGDREHHALAINQDSCQTTEGPTAGSVYNDVTVMEWGGPQAKELSGFGVGRKPGAIWTGKSTSQSSTESRPVGQRQVTASCRSPPEPGRH
jgi:hypothetical protein